MWRLCFLAVLVWACAAQAETITVTPAGGAIVSGTTPITGGADKQVCSNDAGTLRCGDAAFTFNKATGAVGLTGSITNYQGTMLGASSTSFLQANTLLAGDATFANRYFGATSTGTLQVAVKRGANFGYTSGDGNGGTLDGIFQSPSAAVWQLGAIDAAAPVAQTLSVQNVIAGTSNTAGVNWTMIGSLSTGSGTNGDIIFQTGGTGAGAAVQNTATTALTLKGGTQAATFGGSLIQLGGTTSSFPAIKRNSAALNFRLADDSADAAITSAAIAASGAATITRAPAANTSIDGLVLTDTTAATAGNQQYSPRLHFTGQGWKTTATAASQTVDWLIELQPVQSTTSPVNGLFFLSQVNGGGYTRLMSLQKNTVAATATALFIGDSTDSTILHVLPASNGSGNLGDASHQWGNLSVFTSATFAGTIIHTGITTDATHTDATVCEDTTSHQYYFGSGAAGICLGTSSVRFKTEIAPLAAGLDQILRVDTVSYRYRPGYGDPSRKLYGFTAEQMAEVMPELVGLDAEGRPNSVDWAGMVPVLVRAIQQQQVAIDELRHRQ